jgi:hypothetical protein
MLISFHLYAQLNKANCPTTKKYGGEIYRDDFVPLFKLISVDLPFDLLF